MLRIAAEHERSPCTRRAAIRSENNDHRRAPSTGSVLPVDPTQIAEEDRIRRVIVVVGRISNGRTTTCMTGRLATELLYVICNMREDYIFVEFVDRSTSIYFFKLLGDLTCPSTWFFQSVEISSSMSSGLLSHSSESKANSMKIILYPSHSGFFTQY